MASIRAAISAFDVAAQEWAFKGAVEHDQRDYLEERYNNKRLILEALIEKGLQK